MKADLTDCVTHCLIPSTGLRRSNVPLISPIDGDGFYEEAVYKRGDTVQSPTLPNLSLTVDAILA